MEAKKIWVSVDGGGTKTRICACDKQGRKLYDDSFGCSNYKSSGLDAVSKTLHGAFEQMLSVLGCKKEEIVGIVMAIAGCDTQRDKQIYKKALCFKKDLTRISSLFAMIQRQFSERFQMKTGFAWWQGQAPLYVRMMHLD